MQLYGHLGMMHAYTHLHIHTHTDIHTSPSDMCVGINKHALACTLPHVSSVLEQHINGALYSKRHIKVCTLASVPALGVH